MSGCFLVSRNDGLGARLLPILSALRLGHEIGVPVRIHWPILKEGTHNTGEYDSLFAKEFIRDHFVSDDEFTPMSARALSIETALNSGPDDLRAKVESGTIYAFSNTMNKTRLNSEGEALVSAQYSRAISLISFSPTVQSYMDQIDRAFAGKESVAYHIRHGDLTRHYRTRSKPWVAKYVPNEIYLEHIKGAATDESVLPLMFGDCQFALDWMKERHPRLLRIGDLVPLDDVTSLQRDFLELYAMSRTSRIIAPKMSGFSQMAAGIGETPVLDIMEDLSEAQVDTAFSNLADRLEHDRASFTNDGDAAQSLAHLVPHLSAKGEAVKAAQLLQNEINQGSSVPFLYQLWGKLAFEAEDTGLLRELSHKSRDAMIFERGAMAEIDAMHAMLELKALNTGKGIISLRRATCLAPFGENVRHAISALCADESIDLSGFYPIDRQLLTARFMTKGKTPSGIDTVDMRMFAWEVRYLLLGTMLRTLTVSGIARRGLDQLAKAQAFYDGKDDDLVISFKSFRTLIDMEIEDKEQALDQSRGLMRENPDHRFALQRHVLNLRMAKILPEAAECCERLIEMAPDIRCYHGVLGDIEFEQKNFTKALDHYEQVNPGRVDYPQFAMRQANLLRRKKRQDEAEALSAACLIETGWLDPFIVEHIRAALLYRDPFEYLPRLEKLAAEGGALRRVHNIIAHLKFRQGKLDEALEYAAKAAEYTPNNIDFKLFEIRLLAETGRREEARGQLAAVATLPRHQKSLAEIEQALAAD